MTSSLSREAPMSSRSAPALTPESPSALRAPGTLCGAQNSATTQVSSPSLLPFWTQQVAIPTRSTYLFRESPNPPGLKDVHTERRVPLVPRRGVPCSLPMSVPAQTSLPCPAPGDPLTASLFSSTKDTKGISSPDANALWAAGWFCRQETLKQEAQKGQTTCLT